MVSEALIIKSIPRMKADDRLGIMAKHWLKRLLMKPIDSQVTPSGVQGALSVLLG